MKQGSEAAWQQTVTNLARHAGWIFYHPPDNRPIKTANGRVRKQHVVPGFPDLLLLRGAEQIVAELKAENGRVSPQQSEWLAAFEAAGVEAYVWKPSDWDLVHTRLTRARPQTERQAA